MLGEVTFTKNDLGKVLCHVDGEPLTHDVENFEGNFTFNSQGFLSPRVYRRLSSFLRTHPS